VPGRPILADLDADGRQDLIGLGHDDELGAFATGHATPRALAAGDLDGDGRLELVIAGSSGVTRVGVTAGPPAAFQAPEPLCGSGDAAQVLVADLARDGLPELLVAVGSSLQLWARVLASEPFGTFDPIVLGGEIGGPLLVRDLDGDGQAEIYVPTTAGLEVLEYPELATIDAGGAVTGVAAGDLDGDGDLDLAVQAAAGAAVLLQEPPLGPLPGFGPPVVLLPSDGSSGIAVADLDVDGHADVLVEHGTGAIIVPYR
jgi:hypothetical protein